MLSPSDWTPFIFDKGDIVGYKDTEFKRLYRYPIEPCEFFALNPLKPGTRALSLDSINVFRNILIEFDALTLRKQLNLVHRINMPYTMRTFSGSKSYHFIISLIEPCSNLEDYEKLVDLVLNVIPEADTKCRNPNRLSRIPGVLRAETGKVQKLCETRSRVSRQDLESFIVMNLKRAQNRPKKMLTISSETDKINKSIQKVIDEGCTLEGKGRHDTLLAVSLELTRVGYSQDEIFRVLSTVAEKFALSPTRQILEVKGIINWLNRRVNRV